MNTNEFYDKATKLIESRYAEGNFTIDEVNVNFKYVERWCVNYTYNETQRSFKALGGFEAIEKLDQILDELAFPKQQVKLELFSLTIKEIKEKALFYRFSQLLASYDTKGKDLRLTYVYHRSYRPLPFEIFVLELLYGEETIYLPAFTVEELQKDLVLFLTRHYQPRTTKSTKKGTRA